MGYNLFKYVFIYNEISNSQGFQESGRLVFLLKIERKRLPWIMQFYF
jgi:hypothetical protein